MTVKSIPARSFCWATYFIVLRKYSGGDGEMEVHFVRLDALPPAGGRVAVIPPEKGLNISWMNFFFVPISPRDSEVNSSFSA